MPKELRKVSDTTGKMRKIRSDSDYDEKYTKELASGIRYKEGLSIPQLCRRWRISAPTYYNWKKAYKDFRDAASVAEMDYAAYLHEKLELMISGDLKGNAGCMIFALENCDGVQYGKKVNVHNTSDEKIQTINIKVLPQKEVHVIDSKLDEYKITDQTGSDE